MDIEVLLMDPEVLLVTAGLSNHVVLVMVLFPSTVGGGRAAAAAAKSLDHDRVR